MHKQSTEDVVAKFVLFFFVGKPRGQEQKSMHVEAYDITLPSAKVMIYLLLWS